MDDVGSWRRGFAIDRRAGWAPAVALPVGAVAVVVNSIRDEGDIRAGILPWALLLVVVAFGVCALATLSLHGTDPSRWMVAGAWWSVAACAGIAVFFGGIAVGAVLGIEEEDLGAAVIPLVLLMAFGLLSMTPALGLLAIGLEKAKRLPWWALATPRRRRRNERLMAYEVMHTSVRLVEWSGYPIGIDIAEVNSPAAEVLSEQAMADRPAGRDPSSRFVANIYCFSDLWGPAAISLGRANRRG